MIHIYKNTLDDCRFNVAKAFVCALLLISFGVAPQAKAQNIFTVAGNGESLSEGDGGYATESKIASPTGVAVGPDGSVYIAATHGIRRIDKQGKISLYIDYITGASNTPIAMSTPRDLDFDSSGNLFIVSDAGIFKASPTKVLTMLAGGKSGFSGDGGPAIDAGLGSPNGIAVDSVGNIYIADTQNSRIRKINTDGIISTVAGNGGQGSYGDGGPAVLANLNRPYDVDVDGDGRIYIADTVNSRIRVVSNDGIIQTAAHAPTNGAWFVTVDGSGAFYYGGYAYHRVLKTSLQGVTTVIAGTGVAGYRGHGTVATDAWLNRPRRATLDKAGNLYVADELNNRIRKVVLNDSSTWTSDYDGDGWSDILWRNIVSGINAIWRTGNASTPKNVAAANADWQIVAQGDFDGDGVSDIFWRNSRTGANFLWYSADSSRAVGQAAANLGWRVAGTGDFNGDGVSDLLWRNSNGQAVIWYSGRSTTILYLTSLASAWEIAGVGDFNADGASDILWRNSESGRNVIWHSGLGSTSTQQPVTSVTNMDWRVVGIGDFDGEGHSDILWRNAITGDSAIWKAADFSRQLAVGRRDGTWEVKGIADYDGDRKSDLLWQRQDGVNQIWRSASASYFIAVATMPGWTLDWVVAPQ